MRTSDLLQRITPGRSIFASTAVLLPFQRDGEIDWDNFERHLALTARTGLIPALNMDTGFGPQLTPAARLTVLQRARVVLGDAARIIAGASAFGGPGTALENYQASVRDMQTVGAEPIVFQSDWLTSQTGEALATAYRQILDGVSCGYGFELGTMFAPFGRIYSLDDYARLMEIPQLRGAKHSSLDRRQEIQRLELRDRLRPDFLVCTGNDLAIDMVMFGSDYLLGLSTFDPEAFALRDQWWKDNDPRFFQLNDALQALGAVAFRDPVPAYKHSAAVYLELTGRMTAPEVHPACPRRPAWEKDILRPLAEAVAAACRQSA